MAKGAWPRKGSPVLDILIRGGTLYDGTGGEPRVADLGIAAEKIVSIKPASDEEARIEIDASGMAVSPGFINILSHSPVSILYDPRSLGELTQGVTTEIFGEGSSMGPLTPALVKELEHSYSEFNLEVTWTRLAEFLHHLERRGTSQNVASFIGTGTLRAQGVGYDDRPATAAELDHMAGLVAEEMADGALGLASALIYPPGSYAPTEELIALCRVAAGYEGKYISHIRNEGSRLATAVEEMLTICAEGGLPGEIFHLKAAGKRNWGSMDAVLERIERARAAGQQITADVYPYTASSTGLTSVIPERFHQGGSEALYNRLSDPGLRAEIRAELLQEERFGDVTGAKDVVILKLREERLRIYQGHDLAEVAAMRGSDPIETVMDLIAEDRSRVGTAFFSMSEDNLRSELLRPWVGVGSDGTSMAPEGVFLNAPTHPRAYGTFARLLGHYVRELGLLSLADAIHRITGLPAQTLGLDGRGLLREGHFADVAVFDPEVIIDTATFANPHQLAVGVSHVIVNGVLSLCDGALTGALGGRALAGPGKL